MKHDGADWAPALFHGGVLLCSQEKRPDWRFCQLFTALNICTESHLCMFVYFLLCRVCYESAMFCSSSNRSKWIIHTHTHTQCPIKEQWWRRWRRQSCCSGIWTLLFPGGGKWSMCLLLPHTRQQFSLIPPDGAVTRTAHPARKLQKLLT